MEGFKSFGYKTKNIKYREMTLGECLMVVVETMCISNHENSKIKVIWTDIATVESYKGIKELVLCGCNPMMKVKIYDFSYVKYLGQEYYKLILSDPDSEEVEK